jgi:hypothetical protein
MNRHSFEERKNYENPQVVIKEQKDREALPMNNSPLKPEEALANIDDEQARASDFEQKFKEKHNQEFRKQENATLEDIQGSEEEFSDPTEELDEKIDSGTREIDEEDLGEITGPAKQLPPEIQSLSPNATYDRHISSEEWNKLSNEERKKILTNRADVQRAASEAYKTPKKNFVQKMKSFFSNKKEAA